MAKPKSKADKSGYFGKLTDLADQYTKVLIVEADNVGSSQFQRIRIALRGHATVLMGKNTMMRRAIRDHLRQNSKLEILLQHLKGNVGLIFTNSNLSEVKKIIESNKVNAPAKVGVIAPCDVIVPKGPTGMEPTMTSFLQALNIASKINKGQVEIINDVHLLKPGDKVGSSESTLLEKLNIKPFSYGLKIAKVYDDGFMYDPAVLELTDDAIISKFQFGVSLINSISLEIGYPTIASLPHSILGAYKTLLGVALETSYTFPEAEKAKQILENPGAFSAAAAPAAAAPAAAAVAEVKEEKKEEPVEDAFEGGIDLFGGEEDF